MRTAPVLHWPKLFEGWVMATRRIDQLYDNGFAYTDQATGWGNGTTNDETGDGNGSGDGWDDGGGGK